MGTGRKDTAGRGVVSTQLIFRTVIQKVNEPRKSLAQQAAVITLESNKSENATLLSHLTNCRFCQSVQFPICLPLRESQTLTQVLITFKVK